MKKILLFAGTTEGRELSEQLVQAGISHTLCVATEYGELVMHENPLCTIHRGRMDCAQMQDFMEKEHFDVVVDATHPYATVVTENIKEAAKALSIPYLRLQRDTQMEPEYANIHYFESNEECRQALHEIEGNILLTTGSKELSVFAQDDNLRERLYVRILPGIESLQICMDQGIAGKQILALQGPFSTRMNEAMLRQYSISCLVTKRSGRAGGYGEKIQAAANVGIPVFVILPQPQPARTTQPARELQPSKEFQSAGELQTLKNVQPISETLTEAQICEQLSQFLNIPIKVSKELEIVLAGVGMGSVDSMTAEVQMAILEADYLLGVERLIEPYQPKIEKKPYYLASQIIPYLTRIQSKSDVAKTKIVILFSGDSGFYSGSQALYKALSKEQQEGRLSCTLKVMPGISSVAALAAAEGVSYQDAQILSIHGRRLFNLAPRIAYAKKTFLLLSGVKDLHRLGQLLLENGMLDLTVIAGYRLSYEDQEILHLSPEGCLERKSEGLYICLILNPNSKEKILTPYRKDAQFLRDKVPMTKAEVRQVSICKLKLHKDAIVYDVGSGSGSIAVEVAGLSDTLYVYAVEKKPEALDLLAENKSLFNLENIEIVPVDAPDGLCNLLPATHAFIGGSGGRLGEILSELYDINPSMRVVINAVTLETLAEIREYVPHYPVTDYELIQMQIDRTREVGHYHMVQAENPVWICSFQFCATGDV